MICLLFTSSCICLPFIWIYSMKKFKAHASNLYELFTLTHSFPLSLSLSLAFMYRFIWFTTLPCVPCMKSTNNKNGPNKNDDSNDYDDSDNDDHDVNRMALISLQHYYLHSTTSHSLHLKISWIVFHSCNIFQSSFFSSALFFRSVHSLVFFVVQKGPHHRHFVF